ncbi:MAG: C4-dicarboxylate ABC transporter permease, partial [candidate division NC10 bacterium]
MRKLGGILGWGAGAYAALASLFHLYTAGYGVFEPRVQRSMHLLFLVPLVFLAFPFGKRSPRQRPSAFDWLWAAASWLASAYLIWDKDRLDHRWEGASPVLSHEVVLGIVMALLVIEACRRSLSPWMAVTISVALVYLGT